MAACATQTFSNVQAAAWNCLKAKAVSAGFSISTDSGSHSAAGVTVEWNYDASAATLSITCTERPWFLSCSTINGKVHELIENSGCIMPAVQGSLAPPLR